MTALEVVFATTVHAIARLVTLDLIAPEVLVPTSAPTTETVFDLTVSARSAGPASIAL